MHRFSSHLLNGERLASHGDIRIQWDCQEKRRLCRLAKRLNFFAFINLPIAKDRRFSGGQIGHLDIL